MFNLKPAPWITRPTAAATFDNGSLIRIEFVVSPSGCRQGCVEAVGGQMRGVVCCVMG